MTNRVLPAESRLVVHETEVIVEIVQSSMWKWALEATLLAEGLIENLTTEGKGTKIVLSKKSHGTRAVVSRPDQGTIKFSIDANQTGYLQAVLLRAYRDGMAAATHIHIEGFLGEQMFDLTLEFDTVKPPMTAEELAKLLAED